MILAFWKLGTILILLGEVHILFNYAMERQEKDQNCVVNDMKGVKTFVGIKCSFPSLGVFPRDVAFGGLKTLIFE